MLPTPRDNHYFARRKLVCGLFWKKAGDMCSHDPTDIHIIGVFERLKRLYDMMHHDK
jgi:hypothetical protein